MSVPVFNRETKVETHEKFSRAHSIFGFFLPKNCKKCSILQIFNICNIKEIFSVSVLINF
ncbi:hypothetical protein CI088_10210 [Enterococcus plantarum]|uniref:Uncharacterized protein n=1 Tax=Enterococcus plantarum TaxID=1077675 RepID=A0A2W3YY67_9ENTE|nr:hypothetical protein CI088_10210 [Enterococcus plantarum]